MTLWQRKRSDAWHGAKVHRGWNLMSAWWRAREYWYRINGAPASSSERRMAWLGGKEKGGIHQLAVGE